MRQILVYSLVRSGRNSFWAVWGIALSMSAEIFCGIIASPTEITVLLLNSSTMHCSFRSLHSSPFIKTSSFRLKLLSASESILFVNAAVTYRSAMMKFNSAYVVLTVTILVILEERLVSEIRNLGNIANKSRVGNSPFPLILSIMALTATLKLAPGLGYEYSWRIVLNNPCQEFWRVSVFTSELSARISEPWTEDLLDVTDDWWFIGVNVEPWQRSKPVEQPLYIKNQYVANACCIPSTRLTIRFTMCISEWYCRIVNCCNNNMLTEITTQ